MGLKNFLTIGIVNLFLAVPPAAARQFAATDSTLNFSVDTARFRINDSLSLGEFYFAIPRQALNFVPVQKGLQARYEIDVSVQKQGHQISNQRWTASSFAEKFADIKSTQSLFNVARFQFKPGSYIVRTRIRDLHSGLAGVKEIPVNIRELPATQLALSDIELATEIVRDTSRTVFYRNGYRVVPNPGRLYGDGLFILRFYFEIYNLQQAEKATYGIRYDITDASGETVKKFPAKQKRTVSGNLVEIGGVNIVTLHTGFYHLNVTISDNQNGAAVRRSQSFYVFRARDMGERQKITSTANSRKLLLKLYETYTEDQLEMEFEAARWIASRSEISVYSALDFNGKRRFMGQFWYSRDPDSTTVRNEFREAYLARAAYARTNFGGLKKGVKSDRGRVLLTYGAPSEIERFPSEQGLRAYQIWQYYETEGGVKFVFVDTRNWGDYQLVHSTARDELHDEDWQRWLTVQPR